MKQTGSNKVVSRGRKGKTLPSSSIPLNKWAVYKREETLRVNLRTRAQSKRVVRYLYKYLRRPCVPGFQK